MSTVVEGKDTIKFVTEEEVNKAEEVEQKEPEGQSAAFNPETGEINWDCPCLGGMAQGPCGEDFKAAFSCFVFSEAEPKGLDCVDKFKSMQDCFRRHPDVYGDEIDDDDEEEEKKEEEEEKKEESIQQANESAEEANVVASCPNEESSFGSWVASWF